MERNVEKMIIEFNGLPGTGKTTVSKFLEEQLLKSGKTVITKHIISESRLKRYISYFVDGTIPLYFLMNRFVKKSIQPYDRNSKKVMSVVIGYYRIYRDFLKNKDESILIIDQGIIQGLVSVVFVNSLIRTHELKKIFEFFRKKRISFFQVDCNISPETSHRRMRTREKSATRLDNYDDDELLQLLKKQSKTFDTIRDVSKQYINGMDIDMECTPEKNVNYIVEQL